MVSTPEIVVITWITTHLSTMKKWTVYPQSSRLSIMDRAQVRESPQAKDRRPNHSTTPPNHTQTVYGLRDKQQKYASNEKAYRVWVYVW